MPLIARDRRPRTAQRGLASLTSLAVAVPIALVATAGPVSADETSPVRVTATTRVDAELFARDPALRGEPTFVTTTEDGVDGVAVSDHNWSTSPPAVGTSFSCDPTGCAGYDGRALADVDEAAGVLRAGAIANMYIGNPPQDGYGIAGYIFATGDAVIEDTITLSAPATVLLTGRLSGLLSATNTDYEGQGNDPEGVVLAQVQFLGDREWNGEGYGRPVLGGVDERYESSTAGPEAVDESFSIPIELPAGTTAFRARLFAEVDYQTYGQTGDLVSKTAMLDFASSLRFAIDLPSEVTATSGSGFLPLTGGAPDEETPTDTTPPVLTLADVTAEATGPAGAPVTYPVVATDDVDPAPVTVCEPASGATFPLGTTTVTCDATDAAGNTSSGSFDVHVVDSTPPALSLPADFTIDVFDPKGLSANYLATATDLADPAPVVVCTPPSGTMPPPGQTTVECTATDASGNSSAGSFVVTMLDARQAIALMREEVRSGPLVGSVKSYVLARLDDAERALAKNDWRGARHALDQMERHIRNNPRVSGNLLNRLVIQVQRLATIVWFEFITPVLPTIRQLAALVGGSSAAAIYDRIVLGVSTEDLSLVDKAARDLRKALSPKGQLAGQLSRRSRPRPRAWSTSCWTRLRPRRAPSGRPSSDSRQTAAGGSRWRSRVSPTSRMFSICWGESWSNRCVRTLSTCTGAAASSAAKPSSVRTASWPRPSSAHTCRRTQPRSSSRDTACESRLREERQRSASSLIRIIRPGVSDSGDEDLVVRVGDAGLVGELAVEPVLQQLGAVEPGAPGLLLLGVEPARLGRSGRPPCDADDTCAVMCSIVLAE